MRIHRGAESRACAPLQTKACGPDIISVLLEPWREKKPTGLEMELLEGDAQLIVAAGRYSSFLAPHAPIAFDIVLHRSDPESFLTADRNARDAATPRPRR